jgi:hypothetical protein
MIRVLAKLEKGLDLSRACSWAGSEAGQSLRLGRVCAPVNPAYGPGPRLGQDLCLGMGRARAWAGPRMGLGNVLAGSGHGLGRA